MFDKYPTGELLMPLTFDFLTNHYRVWLGGKIISSGSLDGGIIRCRPHRTNEMACHVSNINIPLRLDISDSFELDTTYFNQDRIIMATIPQKTNIETYSSFVAFRMLALRGTGLTREKKDFASSEPFACSVFTINQKIVKIAFSFGKNPRRIEFFDELFET